MVKAYLRFAHRATLGLVCSPRGGICFHPAGRLVCSSALQDVLIWNVRLGSLVRRLPGEEAEVTCLALAPNSTHLAVGYADGVLRVWDIDTGMCTVTFNGHASAVTALRFDHDGSRLASGSQDTTVVVWDITGETGLFRLKGHKDMITGCAFLDQIGALVTSSKDTLVKIWDTHAQLCVQTLVGHRHEVWGLDVNADESRLVTGSADSEIRVWDLHGEDEAKGTPTSKQEEQEASSRGIAVFRGSFPRQSRERVATIQFSRDGGLLGVQGTDRQVEIFRVRSKDEVAKKLRRRRRRQKLETKEGEEDSRTPDPTLEFVRHTTLRVTARLRSFAFSPVRTKGGVQIALVLNNNMLEVHTVAAETPTSEPNRVATISLPGHRSDVRAVGLSSDDQLFFSGSSESVKVWNAKTLVCIRTIESGYVLCGVFVPGNHHVLVGTKEGNLELFDIAAATILERTQAHSGAIWSVAMRPDGRGFVTGSADKEVRFWDFELVEDPSNPNATKRLSFIHTQTLQMSEDVLCVRYSPKGDLVAVALLDSTVKIFFTDTLKFFLSLYGHKLPVLSMDISSDATLLVTASADKNVKIWGLDFGDCHKSLFAHQDSVTGVQFVPGTHYFFTTGKDHVVKYWDADRFETIMSLNGHLSEVWCLVVSSNGEFVVTGSHDRSLRVWERTEEQLFIEEEKEAALERKFETEALAPTRVPGDEVLALGKPSIETVKAGEQLMEALDLAEEHEMQQAVHQKELQRVEQSMDAQELEELRKRGRPAVAAPTPNPQLLGLTPLAYVLRILKRIRSSDLEDALLVLPFSDVMRLFPFLNQFVKQSQEIELVSRTLLFLLKVHQNQIVSTQTLLNTLDSLNTHTRQCIGHNKDLIGFNLAAMRFLKRSMEEGSSDAHFFKVAEKVAEQQERRKKKRRRRHPA